jgi:hypothetical protein
MTFGCPIWSRDLPVRLAAGAAPMFGPIGNRLKRMPDRQGRAPPLADGTRSAKSTASGGGRGSAGPIARLVSGAKQSLNPRV